jgi:hypothetical protein
LKTFGLSKNLRFIKKLCFFGVQKALRQKPPVFEPLIKKKRSFFLKETNSFLNSTFLTFLALPALPSARQGTVRLKEEALRLRRKHRYSISYGD